VYSEPLVRKVGKYYESLGDPVDYEGECTNLLETLQAKKKKIDLIDRKKQFLPKFRFRISMNNTTKCCSRINS